jgi:hypothetical protein
MRRRVRRGKTSPLRLHSAPLPLAEKGYSIRPCSTASREKTTCDSRFIFFLLDRLAVGRLTLASIVSPLGGDARTSPTWARTRADTSARVRSATLHKALSYFTTPHWLPLRQKQTGPSDSLLGPKKVCCIYIRSRSERSGLCTFRMLGSAPAHRLAIRSTEGVGRWESYLGLS